MPHTQTHISHLVVLQGLSLVFISLIATITRRLVEVFINVIRERKREKEERREIEREREEFSLSVWLLLKLVPLTRYDECQSEASTRGVRYVLRQRGPLGFTSSLGKREKLWQVLADGRVDREGRRR